MRNVTLKGLLAHKLRLALTALAIVLGVTFISGTFILTDTLHNTFTTLFGNIYPRSTSRSAAWPSSAPAAGAIAQPAARVAAGHRRAGCPASTVADGSVTGYAQFVARDGKADRDRRRAHHRRELRPVPAALRAAPRSAGRPPSGPDDVVMDAGTAQKYGFSVGQRVRVLLGRTAPRTFTITGIAQFGTANNLAGATLAAFTLPTAQALLDEAGPARRHQRA